MKNKMSDEYAPTPPDLARSVRVLGWLQGVPFWDDEDSPEILEPAAGHGVLGEQIKKMLPNSRIIGIDQTLKTEPGPVYSGLRLADLTDKSTYPLQSFDYVIGHLPAGRTQADFHKITRNLYEKSSYLTAFLVRMNRGLLWNTWMQGFYSLPKYVIKVTVPTGKSDWVWLVWLHTSTDHTFSPTYFFQYNAATNKIMGHHDVIKK
jgi:hypothetical protein